MGLLNLFVKKDFAKEAKFDCDKFHELLRDYTKSFPKKYDLVRYFRYGQYVEEALKNPEKLKSVLQEVKNLLNQELVDVSGEEKLEKEIVADLISMKIDLRLRPNDILLDDIENLVSSDITFLKGLEEAIKKLHIVLNLELQVIDVLLKNPTKDVLLNFFELVYNKEWYLSKLFIDLEARFKDSYFEKIKLLVDKIKSGEKLENNNPIQILASEMRKEGSKENKLVCNIYTALQDISGAPFRTYEEVEKAIKGINKMIETSNKVFLNIVKKETKNYTPEQRKLFIEAFKLCYFEVTMDLDWYT